MNIDPTKKAERQDFKDRVESSYPIRYWCSQWELVETLVDAFDYIDRLESNE